MAREQTATARQTSRAVGRDSLRRLCVAAFLAVPLLAPATGLCAKVVTYRFTGALTDVPPIAEEIGLAVDDPVAGSFTFDSGAQLLPPVDENDPFWTYHATGIFTLAIGPLKWSNGQPGGKPCAVWMHMGWPSATFVCPFQEDDSWPEVMRLDFWIASGSFPVREPYPLGPFEPETFRALDVRGQLFLAGQEGAILSKLVLTDVQFTSEPGVIGLMTLIALALGWVGKSGTARRIAE